MITTQTAVSLSSLKLEDTGSTQSVGHFIYYMKQDSKQHFIHNAFLIPSPPPRVHINV